MKTLLSIVAACMALVIQTGVVGAHVASASGHCTGMTVTDFITSDTVDTTNSMNWENLADGARSFIMSAQGCALVTFSGVAAPLPSSANYAPLHVQTVLDGTSICSLPTISDVFLSAVAPAPASANSITRVCEHVTAGPHSVQVQYRSGNGDPVQIRGHMLVVTHN